MSVGVGVLEERSNRRDRRTPQWTLPQWTAGVSVNLSLPHVLLVSDKLSERWRLCRASDHWQVWKALPGQGLLSLYHLQETTQEISSRGWRDALVLKRACCSFKTNSVLYPAPMWVTTACNFCCPPKEPPDTWHILHRHMHINKTKTNLKNNK